MTKSQRTRQISVAITTNHRRSTEKASTPPRLHPVDADARVLKVDSGFDPKAVIRAPVTAPCVAAEEMLVTLAPLSDIED
jgi:hypothetical protein